jgi:exosome complex component RRP45
MSSAKLGKIRCVEICEMLEVALDEAEGKAQAERMERLKKTANVVINLAVEDVEMMTTSNAMDIDQLPPSVDSQTDAAARKEEEEYRKIALDYSSGHFAASVKEDKYKKDPNTVKKPRGETSSLFNAILRSAKSSSMPTDTSGFERKLVLSDGLSIPQEEEKEKVVEIIAHRVKSVDLSNENKWHQQNNVTSSSQAIAIDSDEEEIVELQTEFSSDRLPTDPDRSRIVSVGKIDVTNDIKDQSKTKNKSAHEDEEITDLSQALKKKKKKVKKSIK